MKESPKAWNKLNVFLLTQEFPETHHLHLYSSSYVNSSGKRKILIITSYRRQRFIGSQACSLKKKKVKNFIKITYNFNIRYSVLQSLIHIHTWFFHNTDTICFLFCSAYHIDFLCLCAVFINSTLKVKKY